MRILSLKLKNLNSLKGEWQINFTNSAYQDSGIFAITGQTGAGKTTILDAICLALYGKTPRVEIISKSTNEVMSRGSFECMAEIEFDIKGQLYRCNWSQYRARKQADGNLQDVTHTFSKIKHLEDDEGQIIESKASITKKKIIETVGMDFEQFTRSVLLAQGQFSKFLKAKSDDRANILEKITGTDIYANISKRVFEKKRTNDAKLKELTANLDGIELLSEAQISQVSEDLKAQQTQQDDYRQTLLTLNEHINWQNTLDRLNADIGSQTIELTTAQQNLSEFTAEAIQLTNAQKALEIESHYQQLENARLLFTEATAKTTTLIKQLPTQKSALDDAIKSLAVKQTALDDSENTLKQQLPIINEIKTLDHTLANDKLRLDDSQIRMSKLNDEFMHRNKILINNTKQIEDHNKKLIQVNEYLNDNPNHKHIDNDREKLFDICKTIKELLVANAANHNQLIIHTKQGNEFDSQQLALSKEVNSLTENLSHNKSAYDQLEKDSNKLLSGKSINDWRNDLAILNQADYQLQSLQQQHLQLTQLYENTQRIVQADEELSTQNLTLTKQVDAQHAKVNKLETLLQQNTENLSLQQQVLKLEQYIQTLQDDAPCPLCGAKEHPYLTNVDNGSHPNFNSKTSQIDNIKEQQKRIDELSQSIKTEQTELVSIQQMITVNTTKQSENKNGKAKLQNQMAIILQEMQTAHHQLLVSINLKNDINCDSVFTADFASNLDAQLNVIELIKQKIDSNKAQHHQKLESCQNIIKQVELLEQQSTANKSVSDHIGTQLNQTQNQLNALESKNKLFEQQLSHINENIAHKFVQLSTNTENLTKLLSSHDTTTPLLLINSVQEQQILNESQYEKLLEDLRSIAKQWNTIAASHKSNREEKFELEKSIAILASSQSEIQNQQTTAQQEIDLLTVAITKQQAHYQANLSNRQKMFTDKNPTDEENRLRSVLSEARENVDTAKQNKQILYSTVDRLTNDLSELTLQISNHKLSLDTLESKFEILLNKHGFTDTEKFLAARLTQEVRNELQNKKTELTSSLNRIQALLDNNKKQLTAEKSKQLTQVPLAMLIAEQNEVAERNTALNKLIGANQQKLSDDSAKQDRSIEQQQAIEKQRMANKTWDELNILIGSSDGKKFRIFAQGLTFKSMIQNANAQLQKMSDRYLLIMDENEALELNVIDSYQAGEIRSCKNLSGGESFIISLALALGLSQMASNNISVDSLFLDEGFGTLDEDSLDIALGTLTSLQQEGKIIGVISHVKALKDRIHTQILVEKISGGVSKISGAGVTRA